MSGSALRAATLATLVFCATLVQGQAPPDSLGILARQAETIIVGTCRTAVASWEEDARVIVTRATFAPETVLKGSAGSGLLEVRVLGGRVGDVRMGATGVARLTPGERAVLFLRRGHYGNYQVIVGGRRGKLPVTGAPGGPRVTVGNTTQPLDLLTRRIKRNLR